MNIFGKFLKMCILGIILMIISTSEISTIFADEIADGFVVDNPDKPLNENAVVDNPDKPLNENAVVDNPDKLQEETRYNNLLYYYENILGRNANIAELKYWKMQENIIGLNAVIKRIVFSEEYITKNTNNKEYINMLYKTVLKREADQEGFNYWAEILNTNQATREFVLNEFLSSNEFIKSGIH